MKIFVALILAVNLAACSTRALDKNKRDQCVTKRFLYLQTGTFPALKQEGQFDL
jgi:hypothetical protein